MKKILVLGALIVGLLVYFSLTANYDRNNTNYKGWPIAYQQTQKLNIQQALCMGVNSDLTPATGCYAVFPTNNYFAIASDVVFCILAGLGIANLAHRLEKK